MKIAVVGGGPGGLYFAALAKQLDPAREVTVWERNAADDTFGFGVVFSDETLGGIENADTVVAGRMAEQFARWTDIDITFRGRTHTIGGQGFAAMSRKELLRVLQERCRQLGVLVHFQTLAPMSRSSGESTTWSSPRTAPTPPSASVPRRCSRPRSTAARRNTCGWEPTVCSRRSPSS
ncbi:NAD(P)-binding protein [Microbacterium sp. NIBRBAC000506063]|uniref:NAD(P)-binding protein n=1 Tax=Microbacterium sp. NIBRBAC000506063 TaxID=2734618 RepID=UPI001CB73C29|nr:NAD(P)-binding protein [Microbacterium sp. NIBRBAC000506063]